MNEKTGFVIIWILIAVLGLTVGLVLIDLIKQYIALIASV